MAYWMYKCNAKQTDYAVDSGDWEYVFGPMETSSWGNTGDVPQLGELEVGDTLLAYQTDKNSLVGIARVAYWQKGEVFVQPLRRIGERGVKVRPLKKKDPKVDAIPALQGGPIQTIYAMTPKEVDTLLRAAARELRAKAAPRMLIARVGWATYYDASRHDETVERGGSWPEKHERFNFQVVDGRCYGFFYVNGELKLHRIDAEANVDSVDDVLVVFVATHPTEGEQRIVGWYEGATVYREAPPLSQRLNRERQGCWYSCETDVKRAVLLPTEARESRVPRATAGKGGIGQANVAYTRDTMGEPITEKWVGEVWDYVVSYTGGNLVEDPETEAHEEEDREQKRIAVGGMRVDAELRGKIEQHAMQEAKKFFTKKGYQVEVWGKPYDLHCTKGDETLFVEVKGSTGPATEVILTKNEVKHAREHAGQTALFIVDSIEIHGEGEAARASGGTRRVFNPWIPAEEDLTPISYWYRVPDA